MIVAASAEGPSPVVSLTVTLRRQDVVRFLGYPERRTPRQGIESLLDDAMEEARRLAVPQGVFRAHPVERSHELGLPPLEATGLVVGLVTIGGALERRVRQLIALGDVTRALLLDAAGSAAVEEAADRLGAVVAAEGGPSPEPAALSCRVSPGYGGWPIRAQVDLFAALPYVELGVLLLPSMLMSPQKSISFAMWLGADRRPLAGLSGCARCELHRCRYRRLHAGEPQ